MNEGSHQEALDKDVVKAPCGHGLYAETVKKDAQSFKNMTVTERLTVVRGALFKLLHQLAATIY